MTEFKKIEEFVYEIPREGDMLVPARLYVDEKMLEVLKEEEKTDWSTLKQLKNVACLPGIQKHAIALSDCHPGYGSPIGGVVAMDLQEGVITFGGIGFDICCGVNSFRVPLKKEDILKKQELIAEELFRKVPAGLGSRGELALNEREIDEVLVKGAEYAVEHGYGMKNDLKFTELNGKAIGANPNAVSSRAKQRQYKEVGTLGSGNHYLEVQYVEEVFDEVVAKAFGLEQDSVLVSIHCGSRGLGHQIGMDYLQTLSDATEKYGIKINDRELVCAPIQSEEGKRYFSAVNAGTNCAFANRQVIVHLARGVFSRMYGIDEKEMGLVYGVGHNTAKIEEHEVDGRKRKLLVHRKGSTRGFGPGREDIPKEYRKVGQPILVGGTMGTASYVLTGTEKGMKETFGSAVHGAGRAMSRNAAIKQFSGENIVSNLRKKGIIVKGHGLKGIAEEAPNAYKRIEEVIEVMHASGVARKVVKLKPLICVKG